MVAGLYNFFTSRYHTMKRQISLKRFRLFLENINGFVDLLKGVQHKVLQCLFFNYDPTGILLFFVNYFLVIKYRMLNLTKCLLAAETFAIIH